MSDIKISVETAELPAIGDELTIIRVDGVIDTMTASELEKVANSILAQKRYKIVVDLGGVDYISSAGWGIFISIIREIRLNNGDIKLARMIPNVYEIFELLEFDSILKAFDNIEKAKKDFAGLPVNEGVTLKSDKKNSTPITSKIDVGAKTVKPSAKPSISIGETAAPEMKDKPVETAKSFSSAVDVAEPVAAPAKDEIPEQLKDLKQSIMDLVGKDPFLSVGEMKNVLARDFPGIGFFKVWRTLRKLGLGSKKKRFYFARTRRFAR
jgi:anti-sigma B factor antagonist